MFQEDEESSPAVEQESNDENDDENSVCLFSDIKCTVHFSNWEILFSV